MAEQRSPSPSPPPTAPARTGAHCLQPVPSFPAEAPLPALSQHFSRFLSTKPPRQPPQAPALTEPSSLLPQPPRSPQSPALCFVPSPAADPALLRGYLQGMEYGSAIGNQLIKRGRIEMLPKGHQPHQLVCRNLGQSDKSSALGTDTARSCPRSTVPSRPAASTALAGKPAPALHREQAKLQRGGGRGIAHAARTGCLHPLLAPHLWQRSRVPWQGGMREIAHQGRERPGMPGTSQDRARWGSGRGWDVTLPCCWIPLPAHGWWSGTGYWHQSHESTPEPELQAKRAGSLP